MSLNSITFQEGQKNVTQLGQGGMEGFPEEAGYLEAHACTEGLDGGLSDDDLKKTGVSPEILSEDHFSKDSASWCQASLTKSFQRAEALLRSHLNPSFRWLLRQKEADGSWNFENTFVTCQNLTSRSCSSFQSIEQTVMDMSTHYHILWENERRLQPRGCIKGLSSFSTGDAYYHTQASAFGQQYGQLQLLLEERSKLIFLHEYSQRLRVTYSFVTKLSVLLDHERLLLVSGAQRINRSNLMGNLGLRMLSQELRVQLSHWDALCAKAHSDVYLRKILFWWKEPLSTMCQTFWLLGLKSLLLMEQCIYIALCILATEHLIHVPRDALEDLLVSIQIFNHTVQDKFQHNTTAWRKHVILLSDWPYLRGCLPGIDLEPRTFTLFQLIKIFAEQKGQMMAGQLCLWTSHQSDPITWSALATDNSSFDWKHPEEILSILSNQALEHNSTGPRAQLDNLNTYYKKATKDLQSCSCCTDHPFWSFVHRDCESLDILFQALVSFTDLLLSQTPKQPMPSRPDTTETLLEDCKKLGVRELQPESMYEKQKSVKWTDLIKSYGQELCLELFTQYQEISWMEFSSAAIRCFFYKGHHSIIGSMNQWRDHMMLLLILWLAQGFRREFLAVECGELLNGLCSQILYNTACMHWDEVICDALGYSLKDKCLPGDVARTTTVRTATTERLVKLFNPLFMMLQHLKNKLRSGNGGRLAQLQILDALYRSVATVQTTTFWVMSKSYQFLSSWYLNKFLLITHGDLGVLQASLKRLAQEVEDLNNKGGHSVIAPMTAQFTRGVADLQAFSDVILRIFSMDCKRMSVEIFEQTMPSAKHWRVNYKTELPSSPSEYATSAAQSVIGQVLEGVQPLSEEARVAALTEAMTVFMEAWMEHILKQKIKFSIQGALQLKQDFDLIRDLIRSEEYSLSEELHQRLLSLRVFQQVDSAIMCLLQQPMAKPYMPSQAWEPFRHCCPSITQVDQASGSLNNLDSMDVQAACQNSLTQAQDSLMPELVSALPDSYLPLAQQEWLDLRIHNSSRWKLPGFHCLTRSEP